MELKKIPTPAEILLANLSPQAPEAPPTSPETPSNAPVNVEPQTPPATPEPVTTEIDDWDTPPAAPAPEQPKSFDFASFVKDIGIEAKDETEFKEKVKSLKQAPDPLDGVDDRLKKAVEFSKKGGDYLSYLGIQKVDYTKIDPVELYKSTILSNKAFTPEEAKELLESKSPLEQKALGIQLQQQYVQWQKAQESEFEASLRQSEQLRAERKLNADKELKSTLDKVEKIAGLSLKPHHKQDIYDAITTGRMQRELFYNNKTGDYDYQSMIETYFVKKNLPKILEHVEKVTSSNTLRAHMKETQNVNLDKSREAPEPVTPTAKNPLDDFIERSRMGKR